MRKHFQRSFKCDQISGICGTVTDTAYQSFQIIYRIQVFPDFFSEHGQKVHFRNGIQPFINLFRINQRLFHKASEHAGSHGCFRFIQYPQKRAPLLLFSQSFYQFQISSAGTVNHHVLFCCIRSDFIHMHHGIFLGFQKITEQGTCSNDSGIIVIQPQPLQRRDFKMLFQCLMTHFIPKIPGIQRRNSDMQTMSQIFQINSTDEKCIIAYDFCR